jgi:hypothetical protein
MRDLKAEREYTDRCREALRRMVAGARENVAVGEHTWGDRYTAERLGFYLKTLARDLGEEGDNPPFFGVIAYGGRGSGAGDHARQMYYLGRRHISDAIGRPPMVIDWRAPVSAAFYQASGADPRGIDTRRRFGWSAGTLTSFEDERLLTGAPAGASDLVRREIERARVGPMRDIVATIQPEQDTLVRTDLDVSVCIQGAPGTGKTAVGLHRAAYLLYAHRSRLQRNGVLVLGPNRAFLHYISAVLPTLGEVDVEQTTIEQLLDHEVRAIDEPAAAAVKHDARMADVLRDAVFGRIGRPERAVVVADESYKWRVNQHEFAGMVAEAEADATTYLTGRQRVIARVVAVLQRQAEARGQNCNGVWLRRMARAVTPYVEEVWPLLKADEVLASLLSDPSQAPVLTPEEQRAIAWPRARRAKTARWTAADAVLLDELGAVLERVLTYGHVIVDEAQDLSPMQCRAIARRSEHTSITVLGDLAQGTTAWAAGDWATQLGYLGKPAGGDRCPEHRLPGPGDRGRAGQPATARARRLGPADEVVPLGRRADDHSCRRPRRRLRHRRTTRTPPRRLDRGHRRGSSATGAHRRVEDRRHRGHARRRRRPRRRSTSHPREGPRIRPRHRRRARRRRRVGTSRPQPLVRRPHPRGVPPRHPPQPTVRLR